MAKDYTHPLLTDIGQAAVSYAERGWRVFPVKPGTKGDHPKGKPSNQLLDSWQQEASADPQVVAGWWKLWPEANIGLHLEAAGLVAVDADTYKPDCGFAAIMRGREMPETLVQRSARGGTHYVFRVAPGEEFKGKIDGCAGVEIKHKGYILLEPSTFEGGTYRWETDDEPAPAPSWIPRKEKAESSSQAGAGQEGQSSGLYIDLGDLARVIELLAKCRNTLERSDWVDLGHALKGNLGAPVREAWIAFSDKWPGTEPGDPARFWDTAKPDGSLGMGTIFYLLKKSDPEAFVKVEPDDVDGFDLSHDALANDLGERLWDQNARHVALWGQWLFWAKTHWARDVTREDFRRTRMYLGTRAKEILRWAERKAEELRKEGNEEAAEKLLGWAKREGRLLRHKSTVAAVESLAQSNRGSAVRHEIFDADPSLLGTPGGTADLKTGELREARREAYITRLTAVGPATGTPVRWLALLEEIFQGDRELIAFMQRAAGYSLTGEVREHRLLFPFGSGANGKSTFLEALTYVWGDYATRIPASSLLNKQHEQHPTDIAGLLGARLVVGSELERGRSWDEAALKNLTGGDTIKARFMRQDFFVFQPQFTLWIAGNTQPSFRGVDEALRRRVVLIPFTVTIPAERRDPELPAKLREEAGQILAWAMEGAVEWYRRGLDVPDSIQAASQEYMDGEDTLGQFLADETEPEPLGFVGSTQLYQRFCQWAQLRGLGIWALNNFSKEIKPRLTSARRASGAGYSGLRLR